MPTKPLPTRPGARPSLETLEDRSLPALFGLPWADAARLTVSFAPDGTALPAGQSDLQGALDAQAARADWQREVLRAFQTWAVHANVNFAVVPDGGQALGAAGRVQGDARFGDVRLAGQALSREVLAVSVPHDPGLAGSWAGDVLFNTAALSAGSLFRVAAHEAAHVLGLGNSTDPASLRFSQLGGAAVTAADVAALQALYGARRPDANEGRSGNDTRSNATFLNATSSGHGSFNGATPVVAFGDITTTRDVDWFVMPTLDDYRGPVTFRVQSAGLSLLGATLSVYDSAGRLVGTATGTDPAGNTVSVRIDSARPESRYYARVTSATGDVFGVGRYAIIGTFDARLRTTPEEIARAVRQLPTGLSPDDVDDFFRRGEEDEYAYSPDYRTNDTVRKAEELGSLVATGLPGRYYAVGSISPAGDVDVYRLRLGSAATPQALIVTVSPSALNGTLPNVEVLDERGRVLPTEVLVRTADRLTVQAVGLAPGRDYHVRVRGAAQQAGNYELSAQFSAAAVQQTTFTRGAVTDAAPAQTYRLFVGQSQLFQFSLAAFAASAGASGQVVMELRDDRNNVVLTLAAGAGELNTAAALFLAPGAYTVTFRRVGAGSLAYVLRGASLSDPIGPTLTDPTLAPQYQSPSDPSLYLYPGNVLLGESYFWALIMPSGPLLVPGPDGTLVSAYPVFGGTPQQ